MPQQTELRAQGLIIACFWAYFQGDYNVARRLADECLALSQHLESSLFTGQALVALACLDMVEGRDNWAARALPVCEEAERHLRNAGDHAVLARHVNNIAAIWKAAGELNTSTAKVREAAGIATSVGDSWLLTVILASLADIEFESGDIAAAEEHWKETLETAAQNRMRTFVMLILMGLARVAWVNGSPQRCLRLLGAASGLQRQLGWVLEPIAFDVASVSATRQAAELALGQEAAHTAWREGDQMPLAEIVRYGVADVLTSSSSRSV
jgi:ATP/maltotriose-dependent transcriptional regulator MalT